MVCIRKRFRLKNTLSFFFYGCQFVAEIISTQKSISHRIPLLSWLFHFFNIIISWYLIDLVKWLITQVSIVNDKIHHTYFLIKINYQLILRTESVIDILLAGSTSCNHRRWDLADFTVIEALDPDEMVEGLYDFSSKLWFLHEILP